MTDAEGDVHRGRRRRLRPGPGAGQGLTDLAAAGALDGILISQGGFYQTDFTKQVLFMGDGSYLDDAATAANLQGNTWGMMNETGSYPGQAWLWLYSFWYHVPGWRNSANVDLIAIYMTGLATLLLLLVPFIPGLRDIPRWIPVHRLIWRTPEAPPSRLVPPEGTPPAPRPQDQPAPSGQA